MGRRLDPKYRVPFSFQVDWEDVEVFRILSRRARVPQSVIVRSMVKEFLYGEATDPHWRTPEQQQHNRREYAALFEDDDT